MMGNNHNSADEPDHSRTGGTTVSDEMEERRGMERRVFALEQQMVKITTTVAVTETLVTGLISTMESRHKAFERGQDLILEKLKPLDLMQGQSLHSRIETLERVKEKAAGALLLVQLLGIMGIIGGVIAIVRMIKG